MLKLGKVLVDPDLGKEMRQSRPSYFKKRLELYNEASTDLMKRMRTSEPLIGSGPVSRFPPNPGCSTRYGRLGHTKGHETEILIPALIGTYAIPRLRCTHDDDRLGPRSSCLSCYERFIADWYVLSMEVLRHDWNGHRMKYETAKDQATNDTRKHPPNRPCIFRVTIYLPR